MRTLAWCFAMVLLMHLGSAQWIPAGMPFEAPDNQVFHFNGDSTNAALYMAGQLRDDQNQCCILRYSGGSWEPFGYFNAFAFTACTYLDTLIIGGYFSMVNGAPINNIAYWNGSDWQPYGSFNGTVRRLEVVNGELYALGSFDMIDDQHVVNITKRVGGAWQPVGDLTCDFPSCDNIMRDITTYNGDIVVCGTFFLNGLQDVMRFDGTDWLPLGEGLHGDNAVTALQEYNGDLYIAGTIDINGGNPGHAIVRWDGQEFHGLGIGPQLIYNSYQYLYRVNSLTVHRGKLIAGGGFQYANLVPASMVAAWDGTEWCGVGGYTDGEVLSVTVFQDTLWAACWGGDGTFNGIDMNGVAKYVWPEYADTCSDGTIGLPEFLSGTQPKVWPVPASGQLQIQLPRTLSTLVRWRIEDATGRVVHEGSGISAVLDVSGWRSGLYLLRGSDFTPMKVLVE